MAAPNLPAGVTGCEPEITGEATYHDDLASAQLEIAQLKAELSRVTAERNAAAAAPAEQLAPLPLWTRQALLDVGVNIFGLDLLLKSLTDRTKTAHPMRVETEYRGQRWRVVIEPVDSCGAAPETEGGE